MVKGKISTQQRGKIKGESDRGGYGENKLTMASTGEEVSQGKKWLTVRKNCFTI